MKKQILIIIAVLGFIVILGFIASFLGTSEISLEKLKGQTILYFGNICPHCEELEEYIRDNRTEEKIIFIRKEVYADLKNSRELTAVAKSCNITENAIGVPFLYVKGTCFMGKDEIIPFLTKQVEQVIDTATPSGEKKN